MLDIIFLISSFFCLTPILFSVLTIFSCIPLLFCNLPCIILSVLPLVGGIFLWLSILGVLGFFGAVIGWILGVSLMAFGGVFVALFCFAATGMLLIFLCPPLIAILPFVGGAFAAILGFLGSLVIGAFGGGLLGCFVGMTASVAVCLIPESLFVLGAISLLLFVCSISLTLLTMLIPLLACLPFASCFAIEGMLSLGACLLIPVSFLFLYCLPIWCIGAIPFFICFPPCIFQIPYITWCGGHCLSCATCNLIDLVWLTATPICTIASLIGGTGAWICCPCAVWIYPLTFAGTCGILGGKFCYLCSSFPYTCWLEPIYCCWLGFDFLFYYFGCLLAPVCIVCSLPLVPFTWVTSLFIGVCCVPACLLTTVVFDACCLFPSLIGAGLGLVGFSVFCCLPSFLCPATMFGTVFVTPCFTEGTTFVANLSKLLGKFGITCPVNVTAGQGGKEVCILVADWIGQWFHLYV